MNQEIKAQWVAALRSGEYLQGLGTLTTVREVADSDGVHKESRFCCLGVLSELARKAGACMATDYGNSIAYGAECATGTLPVEVTEWAGLEGRNPSIDGKQLTAWNDGFNDGCACETCQRNGNHSHSFADIADAIEGSAL